MEQMTFEEFKEYCEKMYVGNILTDLSQIKSLAALTLCNQDPWFHIIDCELYILHLLGIEVCRLNGSCYIYQIENPLPYKINIGDKLMAINAHNIEQLVSPDRIKNKEIMLKVCNCQYKTIFDVAIQLPSISDNIPTQNLIVEIDATTCFFKVNSFSSAQVIPPNQINKYSEIFIDLRCCMGGKINDMIKFAGYFSPINMQMQFEVTDKKDAEMTCKIPKLNNMSATTKIHFIVGAKTASSAEIFCLLLRRYYSGMIYGEKTTGKFVIQNLIDVEGYIVAVPVYSVKRYYKTERSKSLKFIDNKIVPDFPITKLPPTLKTVLCAVN